MKSVTIESTMKKISFSLGVDLNLFHIKNNAFELVSMGMGRDTILNLSNDITYVPDTNKLTTNKDDINIYEMLYGHSLAFVNEGVAV